MKAKNFKCCCTIFLCVCLFLFLFFNFVELKNDNIIASANPENVIVEEESIVENQIIDENIAEINSNKTGFEGVSVISGNVENVTKLPVGRLNNVKYIPNANYYLINPKHFDPRYDSSLPYFGVCTTRALQMLMGYHNYYSDRRLIPSSYLDSDYGLLDMHPAFQRGLTPEYGCKYIGTEDAFFYALYNSVEQSNTSIEQNIWNVRNMGNNFIDNNTSEAIKNDVDLTVSSFSKTSAQSEIDAGRPIVLVMHPINEGLSFHVVNAYGYAKLDGEDGFLVHWGWGDDATQVWVPADWFGWQMTMTVNTHTHNFVEGSTRQDTHMDLTCSICGVTKLDLIYDFEGSQINRVKYQLPSSHMIPENISVYNKATASFYTQNITIINDNAFANQTALINLWIAQTVTSIGEGSFKNCSNLSYVYFYSNIVEIRDFTFDGCPNISYLELPDTLTKIGIEAFEPTVELVAFNGNRSNINLIVADGTKETYINNGWDGFNFVELSATGPLTVTSGQLKGDVSIPTTFNGRVVTEIGANGFANQTELTSISIPSLTKIGSGAFANCTNLEGLVFWSQQDLISVPNHTTSYTDYYYTERSLGVLLISGCTYTLSFEYSGLTSSTDVSSVFTSLGVGENSFAYDLPVQKAFSSTSGTQTIVFTPTKEQLANSNKLWCRFIRTSTPQTVSVSISDVRLDMGVTTMAINAFDGCPNIGTLGLEYTLLPGGESYSVSGIGSTLSSLLFYMSNALFIPAQHNGLDVVQIEASAFAEQENLRWVFMQSENLSYVGNSAFQFCYNLELLNMSATSVTDILAYTFDTCKLGTVELPDGLLTIGDRAFIRTGTIGALPNSVTTIGSYAFAYRPGTLGLAFPDDLYSIGSYAFAYSEALIFTNENTALTIIGDYAFLDTTLPANSKIPAAVTTIGVGAFENSGFLSTFALPAGNLLTSIGAEAFKNCNLSRIVLSSSVNSIGAGAFAGNDSLTIYTAKSSRPSGWNTSWNSSNRPVIWGCTLSADKSYVVSINKTSSSISNSGATNGITDPYREDYTFGGWYATSDFSGTKFTDLASDDTPLGTLYAKWTEKSCVAEGTMVTLADGSEVAVESLTGNEQLLVWNLLTGSYDVAPILFVDCDELSSYRVIELTFNDGTEVKVIDEHGFWCYELNEYVYLDENASSYVGYHFNKKSGDSYTSVTLVGVEIYYETTRAYSPVTYGHLCYFVNGMLSMPGGIGGLFNIFEVDATTMSYDQEAMEEDIAEYGLYTYEEFIQEVVAIPEEIFNAFNGAYLKVAIGKGLITEEEIVGLAVRYAEFF